ncbi:MAG: DNA mismatch repair protein MutS, partial [Chloroflexi bacterium]|nr:DNA mismatch repair protein MutS [Chloroflexota bacterium]
MSSAKNFKAKFLFDRQIFPVYRLRPMAHDTQLTPMMAQYRRIKTELPVDALLLFRLGDFYEMFFEDARAGAQLLNVALTQRGLVPMCGIPHHAAPAYIARLLKAGRKVAICDQLEDARPGQLVKREVTQILSPGTHFDERMLSAERNNYLAAVGPLGKTFGLAFVDLTTGDFKTTELEGEAALLTELERLRPAEIIFPSQATAARALLQGSFPILNGYEDWVFAPETAQFTLRDHFKVASLDGFGLKKRPAAIGAAGAVLHYLTQHLRRDVAHLSRLSCYQSSDYLVLDATSLRNLEILEPLHRDAPPTASLYGALNRTVTPMGARRLRDWLTQPLAAVEPIRRRQEAVQVWIDHAPVLDRFRQRLGPVRDLERTISRLSVGTGNARDLLALRGALEQIPALRQILRELETPAVRPPGDSFQEEIPLGQKRSGSSPIMASSETGPMVETPRADGARDGAERASEPQPPAAHRGALLHELESQLADLPDLVEVIGRGIVDEPPLAVKEGGLIRDGFDAVLDELRSATREGMVWIARLQLQVIDQTGIPSLKVRFISVFGYYI